jgi:hypothetical protein
MSSAGSPPPRSGTAIRQQLDDLEALLQRMLDLPSRAPPTPEEPRSRPPVREEEPPPSPVPPEPPQSSDPAEEDLWVPLSQSWQPSAHTWGPLAESWRQGQVPRAATPERANPLPERPAPGPRQEPAEPTEERSTDFAAEPIPPPREENLGPVRPEPPPLRASSPPPRIRPPQPFVAPPLPVNEEPESEASGWADPHRSPLPPPLVIGSADPATPAAPGWEPESEAPPRADTHRSPPALGEPIPRPPGLWLRGLLLVNQGFDTVLCVAGTPGRWLSGPSGKRALALLGTVALILALILILLRGFGWT